MSSFDINAAIAELDEPQAAPEPGAGAQTQQPQAPAFDLGAEVQDIVRADEEDERLNAQWLRYRHENAAMPAERQAEVFRTAAALRQMGETPDLSVIEQNLDVYKRKAEAHGARWDELLLRHPGLKDYLLEQPRRQDLIADDIENLDGLAWMLRVPFAAADRATHELGHQAKTFAKFLQQEGGAEAEGSDGMYGAGNWLSKMYAGGWNMLLGPLLQNAVAGAAGAKLGVIAAGPAAAAAAAATAEAGGVGGVAVGLSAGAAGAMTATAALTYYQTVGPAYQRLLNQGVRPEVAAPLASAEAGITGLIFGGTMPQILSKLGLGVGGAVQQISGGAAAALQKKTTQSVVTEFAHKYGESVAHAALSLGAVGAVSQSTSEIAGLIEHGETPSLERITASVSDSMLMAIRDMGIIAAWAPGRAALHNIGEAKRLADDHARLESALQATEQSKLLDRSPDEFRAFIATLGQGGLKNFYAPIEAFSRYWSDHQVGAREVAARLVGDNGEAYDRAVLTGGDLALPADRYLSELGRTEHARGLSRDLKIRADGRTPRQEQQRIEKRAAELAKIPDLDVQMMDGRDLVERFFTEHLTRTLTGNKKIADPEAVAKSTAKLNAESFNKLAVEINNQSPEGAKPVSAWEVFRRYAEVEIIGQKGVRAGDIKAREFADPEALSRLESTFDHGDAEAQMRAYYLDRNSGLLNERGFELATTDPSTPMLAVFSFEGKKQANDRVHHGSVDGALRIAGRVLGEQGVASGMKRGGNVFAPVRDQAHADALAAEMAKALDPSGRVKVRATATAREGALTESLAKLDAEHKARENPGEFAGRDDVPKGYAGREAEFEALANEWTKSAEGDAPQVARLLPEHEAHFKEVGPEQARYETFRDEFGLLNELGHFRAVELGEPEHVMSADLRGIGKLNDAIGKEAVNDILAHVFRAFARVGGGEINAARPHGDELGASGNNRERIDYIMGKLRQELDRTFFYGRAEDGRYFFQKGLDFDHGIGSDLVAAEHALNAAKRERARIAEPQFFDTELARDEAIARLEVAGDQFIRVGREARAELEGRVEGVRSEAGSRDGHAPREERDRDAGRDAAGSRRDDQGGGVPGAPLEGAGPDAAAPARADDAGVLGPVLPGAAQEARDVDLGVARPARATARRSSLQLEYAYSKWDAWQHFMDGAGGADASPSQQADGLFRAWLDAKPSPISRKASAEEKRLQKERLAAWRRQKPKPFPGGHFDEVNKQLGRTKEDGVSGAYEAFVELTKSLHWESMDEAVATMRESVPGLERMRLPDEVADRVVERRLRDEMARELGVGELKQPKATGADENDLVVLHNLSVGNLLHADELGGLAAPSIAITKKDAPLEGFGEISLVGGPDLIDPKTGTPVFDADVYSPRWPESRFKINAKAQRELSASLREHEKKTGAWLDESELERRDPRDLVSSGAWLEVLGSAFLEERGVAIEGGDVTEIARAVRDKVRDPETQPQYEAWALEKLKPLFGERQIVKWSDRAQGGYGGWRRIPYTLENILKELTRKIRQGEEFNYGLGTARSAGAKRFRSLDAIKKARDRITSKEQFEAAKKELDEHFGSLVDKLRPHHPAFRDGKSFGLLDSVAMAIGDSYKRGSSVRAALRDNGFEVDGIPAELTGEVANFAAQLLAMPTEYFEAKPQRAVRLSEFKGAVAPSDAKPEAIEALKRAGLEVRLYDRNDPTARTHAVRSLAEDIGVLFQPGEDGRRGSITFELARKGAGPRRYEMNLDGADASTAAHESFHMLTEVMHDIATGQGAPESVRKDYVALIEWMGHASPEDRVIATRERVQLERRRAGGALSEAEEARRLELEAREEKATAAWEQYLLEGKAPSARLAGPFGRFAAWLGRIYKAGSPSDQYREAYARDLGLTPEVRGIFDRLLATEEQIAATHAALDLQPMPAAQAAMTEEERRAYAEATEAMQADARAEVLEALNADAAERGKLIEEARERHAEQAEIELNAEPVYRALSLLQDGRFFRFDEDSQSWVAGEAPPWLIGEDGKPLRLDRKSLDGILGKGEWRTLPAGTTVAKGGVSPGELVEVLGFETTEALLRSLQTAKPRKQAIDEIVQQRITEEFGPALIENPSALFEEAMAAHHTGAAAKRIILELRALRRKLDPNVDPRLEVTSDKARRDNALRIVEEASIAKLRPDYYQRAEQGAAKRALEAAIDGKIDRAIAERETQLLNHYLYRYARDAKREAEHVREQLDKKARDSYRATLGKAVRVEEPEGGQRREFREYLEAHDAILGSLGISLPPPRAGFTLDAVINRMNSEAADVVFDRFVVGELVASPREFDALTIAQVREVDVAIKNIRAASNAQLAIIIDGKRVAVKELVDKMRDDMEATLPFLGKKPLADQHLPAARQVREFFQDIDGAVLDPETWQSIMGETARSFFMDRYLVARERRDKLSASVLEKVFGAWKAMPQALRDRRFEVIEGLDADLPVPDHLNLGGPRDRQWLWMTFLNIGNRGPKSNAERLTKPFGWSIEDVEAAIGKYLTPQECDFLQTVLTVADRDLWPEISAKEERKTGLAPEKIQASPIRITFANGDTRMYAGGYFPARYARDAAVGEIAAKQAEQSIASFYGPGYERASTPKSHTKERAAGYSNVLDLDWSVVPNHLAQVVHDIAFDEYVRDTARVLTHPDLQSVIYQRLGAKRSVQPRAWLKAVANAFVDAVPESMRWWQKMINPLRKRTVNAAIGLSIPVALGDLTNAPMALWYGGMSLRHGIPAIALGLRQAPRMLLGTSPMRNRALELSAELRHRANKKEQRIKDEVARIGKRKGRAATALERAQMMVFAAQEATEAIGSTQLWTGAFGDAKAEGKNDAEAALHADAVVRRYLPTKDVAEQSAVLRDKRGIGQLLLFYGYFNKRYNMNRLEAHQARVARYEEGGADGALRTAIAAGRILGASAIFGAAAAFLEGKGQSDDEELWQWIVRRMGSDLAAEIPFGGFATPLIDYAVTGTFKPVPARMAPGLSVIQGGIDTLGKMASEKRDDEKKLWDALELLLVALAGPARQFRRTGEYITDVVQGDAQDAGVFGVPSGIIYGEPDAPQGTNAFKEAKRLFE